MQERWEGISKVQDTGRRHNSDEAREIRNSSADDEGDGPVDWNETDPEIFAHFLR